MADQRRLDSALERTLVEQCRRMDFEAFGKVVDAYQGRILGFVKRTVPDVDEALDITQEVFIKAYQAFGQFDGRCSLKTWLFRIAHNLCIDRLRKSGRAPSEIRLEQQSAEGDQIEISDTRWNPENLVLESEIQEFLERGIRSMSEKLRSVLVLHDQEDLGYDEIAQTLGIPVGTVKSRLFLARTFLQEHMGKYLREGSGSL